MIITSYEYDSNYWQSNLKIKFNQISQAHKYFVVLFQCVARAMMSNCNYVLRK